MFSHIVLGVRDFERSFAFYGPIMEALGHALRFRDAGGPWAGWHSAGGARPFFVIAAPFDGQPHEVGNGQMVALLAPSRALVAAVHGQALALGGRCEGAPGLRAHYHPDYFGAYFRDPDGNKICVVCHAPEPA